MRDRPVPSPAATDVVLGLDVGGTTLKAGLVDRAGRVVLGQELPTPRVGDRCDPGLAALSRLAADTVDGARRAGHTVRAAGIGFPEYVFRGRLTSAEVFAWDRQPAEVLGEVAALAGLPGLPILVDADVRCAARAELWVRRGEPSSFVHLAWGTGLSSAVVVDGSCLTGRRGEALAVGEWPVDPRSGTTWPGTLEGFASGRGVQQRYLDRTGSWLDGRELDARASAGDALAREVLVSAGTAVGWAITALVQVLDPPLVVLGGGVGASGGLLARTALRVAGELARRPAPPPVEPSRAGSEAGLVGAGLLAWDTVPGGLESR